MSYDKLYMMIFMFCIHLVYLFNNTLPCYGATPRTYLEIKPIPNNPGIIIISKIESYTRRPRSKHGTYHRHDILMLYSTEKHRLLWKMTVAQHISNSIITDKYVIALSEYNYISIYDIASGRVMLQI